LYPPIPGSSVWIGADTVINPGVTVGNNVVIGSGSVVTKDILDNVIAAGNLCRVLRPITLEGRRYPEGQREEYMKEQTGPPPG
jgi:maltose O-acetyltransferase